MHTTIKQIDHISLHTISPSLYVHAYMYKCSLWPPRRSHILDVREACLLAWGQGYKTLSVYSHWIITLHGICLKQEAKQLCILLTLWLTWLTICWLWCLLYDTGLIDGWRCYSWKWRIMLDMAVAMVRVRVRVRGRVQSIGEVYGGICWRELAADPASLYELLILIHSRFNIFI